MNILTLLADYRDEDVNNYVLSKIRGYTFIDTGSHGYLALGSEDNGYSDALEIARKSSFSYVMETLVFLEEDCDAPEFLKLGLDN